MEDFRKKRIEATECAHTDTMRTWSTCIISGDRADVYNCEPPECVVNCAFTQLCVIYAHGVGESYAFAFMTNDTAAVKNFVQTHAPTSRAEVKEFVAELAQKPWVCA